MVERTTATIQSCFRVHHLLPRPKEDFDIPTGTGKVI